MIRQLLLACLFALGAAPFLSAQQAWLPAEVQDALAEQIVSRVEAIVAEAPKDRAEAVEGMRSLVGQLAKKLDTWGETGVLQRAPEFPRLSLPDARDRHLNAMARYQVCNWATLNQQDEGNDRRTRVSGAMATGGVTLAIVFLRHPFTTQGGKPAQIEGFLSGAPMDAVFQRVMKDAELMTHVEQQCQPLITEMFRSPK